MGANNKRIVRATLLLMAASFLLARLLFWIFPNVFEPWNAQTVDQLFLLRAESDAFRPRYDSTIVHIDISDRTMEQLENSFLSRSQYAQVVHNLAWMEVALQIWDFILPLRVNPFEDSVLVASAANARNVLFGLAFQLSDQPPRPHPHARSRRFEQYLDLTKWRITVDGDTGKLSFGAESKITFPALAASSLGLGYLNIQFDRDGVYRRAPLLVRYEDAFYPSFAFRAACEYLGVTPDRIVLRPGESLTLRGAQRPGHTPHDIVIPIDEYANILVNYIGPLRRGNQNSMLHYDFADILRASDDRTDLENWGEVLRGKIAVVSEVATGASDVGPVPTDNNFPLSGVHSNALNTILTEDFIRELGDLRMLSVELLIQAILFLLARMLSSRNFSIGAFELMLGYVVIAATLFLYANLILNILRPVFEIALSSFVIVTYRYVTEQREKLALQKSFEAYFPPSIVRKIMMNPELVTQGGHRKELTILFSDIKSFTTYSSTLSPDEIQRLLNEYFEAMVEIVFKYGGTVDKFIGDGLMVFFGDPEAQEDHAVRCVKAAIEMQKKCRELKTRWESEGKFPLKIRIGLNTGPVVVGNMGSARRLSYTVLGSAVNLAQRLESNAPVEGIMISHRTYKLVKDHVTVRPMAPIRVKGLEEPIQVYEVPVDV